MAKQLVLTRKEDDGAIWVVSVNRPEVRNAIDVTTGQELAKALIAFDKDAISRVAVLQGVDGCFCAGFDLKTVREISKGPQKEVELRVKPPTPLHEGEGGQVYDVDGPMGYSRLQLAKPVIAAVEGFAVAGGLELACWCDLRVAAEDAKFGVYCRRWGVPLIDGGTFRLPRLIGLSRAQDMILTGRPVFGEEALMFGLANRIVPKGEALNGALKLAREIAAFPQKTMRSDRMAAISAWGKPTREALQVEYYYGQRSDDFREGADRFVGGVGRSGSFAAFQAKL